MKKIALTGGIGTGKTYISRIFSDMGIPVFNADANAKEVYKDRDIIDTLHTYFGNMVFTNGKVDYKKITKYVFGKPEARDLVNRIVSPKVVAKFDAWAEQQTAPCVMMETAILYELEIENLFDQVIVVDAPLDVRIERLKKRDPQLTEKAIIQRIKAQLPQEEKVRRADMVINNGLR